MLLSYLKKNSKASATWVYKWINKYVSLMQKYLDQIKPNVSNVWRTDELYLKVKENTRYLFALMDDGTRFWIAQQVSDNKNTSDIRQLFKEAKQISGKKPNVIISDGARYQTKWSVSMVRLETGKRL